MNDFRVSIFEIAASGSDGLSQPRVSIELTVDGKPIQEFAEVCVDPCALVASTLCDGEYCIGGCTCGEPACAGVWEGVHVSHKDDRIHWSVPVPYARSGDDEQPDEPPLNYEFSANQYRGEVAKVIAFLEGLIPREAAGEHFTVDSNPGRLVSDLAKWLAKVAGGFRWRCR